MNESVKRILDLLDKKGITKNKMLTDLGLSKNLFVNWIKRGTTPNGEALIKISTYLGVSTDYLLGTEKRERPPVRLDLFGGQDGNIELLQEINNQVRDNPVNSDDEMDDVILEIYKRLPEKKRKEALLALLDLLKK